MDILKNKNTCLEPRGASMGILPILFIILCPVFCMAQRPLPIFKDRKIINSFSTETLPKKYLDLRIGHRFGDMFGDNGGWPSFYGFESARDILIGFDYGVTDHLLVGVNRTKGAGPLRMLVNSYVKYKIAGKRSRMDHPVAVTFLVMNSLSTMPKSDEVSAINNFPKFVHRMTNHFQMMLSKRFSDAISLQMNVGYTHRNFVNLDDVNYIIHAGLAGKISISKRLAVIFDANIPMRFRDVEFSHTVPLGFGLEWETGGGHAFQINFTNAEALSEPDYLSYTSTDWSEGEFRLGFTISRQFKI